MLFFNKFLNFSGINLFTPSKQAKSSERVINETGSTACLPSEIKFLIFDFLPNSQIKTVSLVCRKWHQDIEKNPLALSFKIYKAIGQKFHKEFDPLPGYRYIDSDPRRNPPTKTIMYTGKVHKDLEGQIQYSALCSDLTLKVNQTTIPNPDFIIYRIKNYPASFLTIDSIFTTYYVPITLQLGIPNSLLSKSNSALSKEIIRALVESIQQINLIAAKKIAQMKF